ncbi:hypothetical protein XBI1_700028 [Xenorhabdus bovienii str. Intermedium]|uniref:Uncharacterized protein n=1 Tax=Xenorhabdus bovienii str. Intermedium TaxID=1379677 RepID=A0A077QNQ4_XENBV|nr:hypothetical protein XBI1_700028 [Xenorhabdus bovienii str. Intermedium]
MIETELYNMEIEKMNIVREATRYNSVGLNNIRLVFHKGVLAPQTVHSREMGRRAKNILNMAK